jgi:glycosyltransferase involved in cell wall biosynthesis
MATAVATPRADGPLAESTDGHRPLRVCMVHYSDFYVDSRIQRQARALAERGDEVDLICLSPSGELEVGLGKIRIHEIAESKAGGGAAAYLRGYASFFAKALWRVSRLEARRRFHVVEAHNMPDFLTATAALPKLRGAAVILNVHDTFPELYATKFGVGAEHRLVRGLQLEESLSARLADAVITVTDRAADVLGERGVGVGHTTVVMNTPDHSLFGPPRAARALPTDGPVRVLYHGGLAQRFGADLLIRAIGGLASTRERLELRVCGTGDEHARLIALAGEVAPGRADVAPAPIPLAEIPAELEAAHVGVVPTRQDDFTRHLLPVKLMEYVHMGLPAVAPRLPVIERYFSDAELRFFEPDSQASLETAIAAVLDDPDAALERARRAGERLDEIAWPRQRERYLGLVDALARKRTPVA